MLGSAPGHLPPRGPDQEGRAREAAPLGGLVDFLQGSRGDGDVDPDGAGVQETEVHVDHHDGGGCHFAS